MKCSLFIPHKIDNYRITLRNSFSCHSWENYVEKEATKISQMHFKDRTVLADVSPRRCTQCHVSQVDSKPLVENTFKFVK